MPKAGQKQKGSEITANLLPGQPGTSSLQPTKSDSRPEQESQVETIFSKQYFEEMMRSFKQDLTQEIKADKKSSKDSLAHSIADLSTHLSGLEERVNNLEKMTCEQSHDYEALVKRAQNMEDRLEEVGAKQADLENRSRRNNIRLRGILRQILDQDLPEYVSALFKSLLGLEESDELILDRTNRVYSIQQKKNLLPNVLSRVHFFCQKEEIMAAARKADSVKSRGSMLCLFQDLSPSTLASRRRLQKVTAWLQEERIRYLWGFPCKLLFEYRNRPYTICSEEEAKKLMMGHNGNKAKGGAKTSGDLSRSPIPKDMNRKPKGWGVMKGEVDRMKESVDST